MTANEVLISSSKCGLCRNAPEDLDSLFTDGISYISRLSTAGISYDQQCYGDTVSAQQCSLYVTRQLPQDISRNVSCPFLGKDKICYRNSTNLRIDSGKLDSHEHLGINAPPKDRFTFRDVLECAPLRTREYTQIATSAYDLSSNETTVQILYGSPYWAYKGERAKTNVTFEWPLKGPRDLKNYQIEYAKNPI